MTELKYTSLIKMVILEENFKWHLEAFASELFICYLTFKKKHTQKKSLKVEKLDFFSRFINFNLKPKKLSTTNIRLFIYYFKSLINRFCPKQHIVYFAVGSALSCTVKKKKKNPG